ncbi:MAG: TOBE domain-containing protein [Ignavibacteria bacterium]|nr:TOBE domain-containing protein [Ignavibacteria bacterium]
MNKLKGKITNIQQSGAVMLIDLEVNGQGFSALLIESAEKPEWLKTEQAVNLVFKETEVSLAKKLAGQISVRNRMNCKVINIERGQLLSKVKLQFGDYPITSVITTRAADSLLIAAGEEIEALVKANEISLMKITGK